MRTTLTLDDDLARLLRDYCRQRRQSFKQAVNQAVRAGLGVLTAKAPQRRQRYRVKSVSLGTPRLPDLDNIAEVLAVAEGERHL